METFQVFDTLCPVCETVFNSDALVNNKDKVLHSSLPSLISSRRRGCHLCSLICGSLNDIQKTQWMARPNPEEVQIYVTVPQSRVLLEIFDAKHQRLSVAHLGFSSVGPREIKNLFKSRSKTTGKDFVEQIKIWGLDCLNNHLSCGNKLLPSNSRRLPTRLLDVGEHGTEPPRTRLVATESMPSATPYLTLSHCWGTIIFPTLTSKTISTFTESIPVAILPQTFRDAIELTRLLNFRYIWIDSLCILQDSAEDWKIESALMGEIYAQGDINIAATAAANGNGGLYHRKGDLHENPCIVNTRDDNDVSPSYMFYPALPWERMIDEARLNTRGWVLQERLLSPRVVHFASDQVYWECSQKRDGEYLPERAFRLIDILKATYTGSSTLGSLLSGEETSKNHSRMVYDNWYQIVEKYTQCNLTKATDRMIAISGLARRVIQQLQLDEKAYLAGLWESELPDSLLWYIRSFQNVNTLPTPHTHRSPSWSWSSIQGPVWCSKPDPSHKNITKYSQVRNIHIDHDGDRFGQIKGGQIVLQGHFTVLKFPRPLRHQSEFVDGATVPPTLNKRSIRWDDQDSQASAAINPVFFLLMLSYESSKLDMENTLQYCSGLVLMATKVQRGQYRRLGVLDWCVEGLDNLIATAMDPSVLNRESYCEFDSKEGFTIEIV